MQVNQGLGHLHRGFPAHAQWFGLHTNLPKAVHVFLLILMVGNLAEKSLFFAAIAKATRRATAL